MIAILFSLIVVAFTVAFVYWRMSVTHGDFINAEGGYMLEGKGWHGRDIQPEPNPPGWEEADTKLFL